MKRLEGWVTDFANRYRFDFFFRTECNVIALQISFIIFILITIGFAFDYLYHDISKVLFEEIINNVNKNGVTTPTALNSIASGYTYLKTRNLFKIAGIIVGITALFGYLVARVTLIPARNSLKMQKQFIGNIAHELRTPLAVMKTSMEVSLMQKNFEDWYVRKTLLSNIEELERISDTINNLLSFNVLVRAEHIKFEHVDLGFIIDDIVEKLSELIKSKNLQITIKKNGNNIIEGKPVGVGQIIINLLKNAIQYTPKNGSIQIIIEPTYDNFVELRIEDSGVGISEKDLTHVFEPFYRADPSRARVHGGSGLGLAIVNELVKIHNGKIFIKSALGSGTTVRVSFPTLTARKHEKMGYQAT